jgi:hypothetical protein
MYERKEISLKMGEVDGFQGPEGSQGWRDVGQSVQISVGKEE